MAPVGQQAADDGVSARLGGPAVAPAVGERIRAERARQGLTVRGLAREIGVSASLISQIETDKSKPSVRTLYAITNALGVSMEDLLAPAGVRRVKVQDTGDRSRRVGPVVRASERESLTLDSGVRWDLLGQVPGTHVDFMLVTYEPGASSSSTGGQMRHMGTEYGYVVSGELVLVLGFEEFRLGPGDAFSFPSTTPHSYRNECGEPAVGVWWVLEPGD